MMMKLTKETADIYIPDGSSLTEALSRTTHLCIGAHPDDIEINAYPAVAECYEKPDLWFAGIVVTDGAGSARAGVYSDYTDKEMILVRREEQRKAARLGGYGIQFQLAFSSAEVKEKGNEGVVADLKAILERACPENLYLHNPADKHDTHVAVFLRSLEAARALPLEKRPTKAYGVEGWRDLDWLLDEDKAVLRADAYPDLASALTRVFDSQIAGGKRYDLAIAGRRRSNATFFEAHQTDKAEALTWAIDLTPLLTDPASDVEAFTLAFADRLKKDISRRLRKFR